MDSLYPCKWYCNCLRGYILVLNLGLRLTSIVKQTARLARDLWETINDTWENETRKWEDIV